MDAYVCVYVWMYVCVPLQVQAPKITIPRVADVFPVRVKMDLNLFFRGIIQRGCSFWGGGGASATDSRETKTKQKQRTDDGQQSKKNAATDRRQTQQ